MKKFQTLEEFSFSDEFLRKDLSECDLSNLDLSSFPPSTWEGFTFYETNFTNTNIKFYPRKLKFGILFWDISYCNFTNCDLSYLTAEDLENVCILGCNFTNTNFYVLPLDMNIKAGCCFYGVAFGDAYHGDELEKYASKMDIDTLLLNPNLSFSSNSILGMFRRSYSFSEIENIDIDKVLEIDRKHEGKLWEFWNLISSNGEFTSEDKESFFYNAHIDDKIFPTLDLSKFDYEFLNNFSFSNCIFENVIFPNSDVKENKIYVSYSKTKGVTLPNINAGSWKDIRMRRVFSNITFYRNLYVELGRFCNGKCRFCRNQYLEPCDYDFEKIYENLRKIYLHLDNIVIGGGEPTLLKEDLTTLCRSNMNSKITIFTNGSLSNEELAKLNRFVSLNISRHSIDDDENNKIIGVEVLHNSDLKTLRSFDLRPITLCATCFKSGLDSIDKILDYIEYYSKEVKVKNFLFQTLHQDLNAPFSSETVLPISNETFASVINKLQECGYEISMPIYSTGDYKMIIAKKNGIHISFKQYITKEELESKWCQSPKRTFDLSMDPSGNLYENWHQSSGSVLIKKLY